MANRSVCSRFHCLHSSKRMSCSVTFTLFMSAVISNDLVTELSLKMSQTFHTFLFCNFFIFFFKRYFAKILVIRWLIVGFNHWLSWSGTILLDLLYITFFHSFAVSISDILTGLYLELTWLLAPFFSAWFICCCVLAGCRNLAGSSAF